METILGGVGIGVAIGLAAALAVIWARLKGLRGDLTEARAGLDAARADLMAAESTSTEARTRLEQSEKGVSDLKAERDTLRADVETARRARSEAETQSKLDRQSLEDMRARMTDWEQAKSETLTHAKAAVLETASELSNKLLADHKKESEQTKKESEERIKKTTETLTKDFDHVAKSVKSLADQVVVNQQTVETVHRALSNPGGAGYYAEIGLENTLKAFGLERDRDFVLQHTMVDETDGKRKKPDAVVFLPYDSVLVIDSKASKFLIDLAEAEGTDREDEAYFNLGRTMNQHLRDLAGKDYRGAFVESYRAAGRGKDIKRVLNVMYLPNEGALEKIRHVDPDFDRKAAKAQIILTSATGLSSLIGFARLEIDLGRQAENQDRIVEAAEALLESVGLVLGHAESMGRGLKTAANNYANLVKSANSRLLPRTRALEELGVRSTKGKKLPQHLPAYQVIDHQVIEGEAEVVEPDEIDPAPIEDDPSHKVARLEPRAG